MPSLETRNYMLKQPLTVRPDATINDAAYLIMSQKVSGICVTDENNNLVGMLSELDCLRAMVNKVNPESSVNSDQKTLVSEIMEHHVECNHPHDDIIRVANSMLDHKHRRRPVLIDGKLVGQVTCRQILSAIKDFSRK